MDLEGVERVTCDGVEIAAIMCGELCVWPDPWTDIWDEGAPVYWEQVWRNKWSVDPAPPLGEVEPSNGS